MRFYIGSYSDLQIKLVMKVPVQGPGGLCGVCAAGKFVAGDTALEARAEKKVNLPNGRSISFHAG